VLHGFLSNGSIGVLSSYVGYQPILSHNALYFLVIHVRESHFDVSPTKFTSTFVKNCLNSQEIRIVLVCLVYLREPFVVSASRHSGKSAKNTYISFQLSDDLVFLLRPEFDSALLARRRAKKAFSASRYCTCSSNRRTRSFSGDVALL